MKKTVFKINEIIILAILIGVFVIPAALGSEPIAFTVTPSLLQVNLGPGENWNSGLKIFNNNPIDLILYASVVNLSDKLVPILNQDLEIYENSLANWIKFQEKIIAIPGKQSALLPFSLELPDNAPPVSQSAAILIGTQPLNGKTKELKSAGFISSILSVRVRGAAKASGGIKSFIAENKFYQEPKIKFLLSFENTGNINLNPSGEIKIYNRRGEKKGNTLLSAEVLSVLARKSREFVFNWEGEKSEIGMGRYRAIAALTFGNPIQNSVKEAYFWIMPINLMLGSLMIFFLLPLFLFFAVRTVKLYVYKIMEGEFAALPPKKYYPPPAIPFRNQLNLLMAGTAIFLLSLSAGIGIRYAVESGKKYSAGISELKPSQTASIIHQTYFLSAPETNNRFNEVEILKEEGGQMSFPELFRRLLPFFDKDFLSRTFDDDFTAFRYYDASGSWPGYVAKIKDSQHFVSAIAPVLENYAANFYPSGENLGEFKDGFIFGVKTRYAIGSRPGVSFNYGLFKDYLVISANFDGFKLALKALGSYPQALP